MEATPQEVAFAFVCQTTSYREQSILMDPPDSEHQTAIRDDNGNYIKHHSTSRGETRFIVINGVLGDASV